MSGSSGTATGALGGLRIGILGKGGSGKSTVAVLLARALVRRGYDVAVLDADSTNVGLHRALGIDDPPDPLLEYFGGSVFSGGAVTCPVDDPTGLPEATIDVLYLPDQYRRRSPDGIWLVVAGKLAELGAGAGCDGPIAKITRDLELRRSSARRVMVIDLKAGFEDSARGVLVRLDGAVMVVDPTIVAVRMAAALSRLVDDIHAGAMPATRHLADPKLVALANRLYATARIRDVFVVLNKIADGDAEGVLRGALAAEGVSVTGVIHHDPGLTRAWLEGDVLNGRSLDAELDQIVNSMERTMGSEHRPRARARGRAVGRGGAVMNGKEHRRDLGPAGYCVCPRCETRVPHRRGVPCEEEHCPDCAGKMLREGSYHHQLWLAKHGPGAGARPGGRDEEMTTTIATKPPMVHPADDVLAVIDDGAQADEAIHVLRAAGFADADIHVFRGREEIGALARAWWRHSGVPAFLAPFLAAVLSDERDVEEIYESEGLAGHTVLAVHTRRARDVERATRILRDGGAHDTWYFGRWTMAPLDPVGRHAK